MKKKTICLIFAFWMLLSLSSCNELDRLRSERAVWVEDNQQIIYQDNSYIRLESDRKNIGLLEASVPVYLVEEDVPALLTELYGYKNYANKEKTVLSVYSEYYVWSIDGDIDAESEFNGLVSGQYVREDFYEAAQNSLKNAVFDLYYIESYSYEDLMDEGTLKINMLSENFNEIMNSLLAETVTAENSFDYEYLDSLMENGYLYEPCYYSVRATDETGIFCIDNNIELQTYEICDKNGNFLNTRYVLFINGTGHFIDEKDGQTMVEELDGLLYDMEEELFF